MSLLLFSLNVLSLLINGIKSETSTISAQVMCDNFCQIYYNGELVYDQTSSRRVFTTNFTTEKSGIRTFAAVLFDNPYDVNSGIWQFGASAYLKNDTLDNLWCLGDGGFRAIFNDQTCNEYVGTGADWKCYPIRTGPLDAESCFENGFTTDPTYSNPVERGTVTNTTGLRLYDPCIENPGNVTLLDSCKETVISDYDQSWLNQGFDDSLWPDATSYTLDEALPKRGRPATFTLEQDCTDTNYYCDPAISEESWGDSEFIWSTDIELDNVVLCRFEYISTCTDDDDTMDTTMEPIIDPTQDLMCPPCTSIECNNANKLDSFTQIVVFTTLLLLLS